MTVKGPSFELKEYAFAETHAGSTGQFNTREELFDKYRYDKEISTMNP